MPLIEAPGKGVSEKMEPPSGPIYLEPALATRQVTVAPFADGVDHRHEAPAHRREAILDLGRHGAIVLALDQPELGQRLQLAAQYAGRYRRRAVAATQEAAPDLTVTPRSLLEVPQDADLVLAAHHPLESQHRATALAGLTIIFVHTCAPAPVAP